METNTASNNVWIRKFCKKLVCKFRKKTLSKEYTYQSHMDRCKAYKDHLRSNCIDDEFKQQLKHDVMNEFKLFLDALKNDVINVTTNKNIKQS